MIDKEHIELKNIPGHYSSIKSALGQATPIYVLIEPLHFNKQLVGVLEMDSFRAFNELRLEVLDKLSNQICSTQSHVLFNEITLKILVESLDKEKMLRQQKKEEMSQQVKELIATQEEFTLKEATYLQELETLRKSKK